MRAGKLWRDTGCSTHGEASNVRTAIALERAAVPRRKSTSLSRALRCCRARSMAIVGAVSRPQAYCAAGVEHDMGLCQGQLDQPPPPCCNRRNEAGGAVLQPNLCHGGLRPESMAVNFDGCNLRHCETSGAKARRCRYGPSTMGPRWWLGRFSGGGSTSRSHARSDRPDGYRPGHQPLGKRAQLPAPRCAMWYALSQFLIYAAAASILRPSGTPVR